MFFQLFILCLILGLISYQSLQGLFSSAIMVICAVFALALAFNCVEWLGGALAGFVPEYADAAALCLLFVVSLTAMRVLADRFLPGMVHFPLIADRAGGVVFGAVSSLVIVGVFVICLRMLPFGPSIMGYEGLPEDSGGPATGPKLESLWLKPDEFAVGLVKLLSAGSMSSEHPFARVHPDYLTELAAFADVVPAQRRQAVDKALGEVSFLSPKGPMAYAAAGLWASQYPADFNQEQARQSGLRLFELTIQPLVAAPDESFIWLCGGQVQLTARQVNSEGKDLPDGDSRLVFPGWILDDVVKPSAKIEPFTVDRLWKVGSAEVGAKPVCRLFFVLPEKYRPWFVTVKRLTRVEVTVLGAGQGGSIATPTGPAKPAAGIAVSGSWPVKTWQRSLSDKLPAGLSHLSVKGEETGPGQTNVASARVELASGRLVKAQLQGPRIAFTDNPGGRQVTQFALPPGCKIVQLEGVDFTAAPPDGFWANMMNASVSFDGKQMPLAGLAVKTKGNQWVLCYDRDGGTNRFNLDELKQAGGDADRIYFFMVVPASANELKLDVGGGLTVAVYLTP